MSEKKTAPSFSKAQLLRSYNFTPIQKDVLRAVLKDGESYTLDQAHKLIGDYAKRTVS
jgi:hypothetical protein